MFKKMMAVLVLTFALASIAGASTTTQQFPLPCGCNGGNSGN